MTTALASLFSGRRVKPLLAMTGEVTLSGRVLPVGGVKEKVLGARRAGITTIVLCEKNRKDIMEDLPEEVRENMRFEFVTNVSQVLDLALESAVESQPAENDQATDSGSPAAARSGAKKPRQTPKTQSLPGVVPKPVRDSLTGYPVPRSALHGGEPIFLPQNSPIFSAFQTSSVVTERKGVFSVRHYRNQRQTSGLSVFWNSSRRMRVYKIK